MDESGIDYSFTGPSARKRAVDLYTIEVKQVNSMIAEIQGLLKQAIDSRICNYTIYTIRYQHLRRQLFRRLLEMKFTITTLQSGRVRIGF
jgi:hypothetical protein